MGYQQITLGLTLTVPTSGTRNWGSQILVGAWNKISQHDHSGSGNGNQINTSGLADGSVTTPKIADANVTTVKILDSNVTTAKIGDLNVTTAKIADLNVTTGKLADDCVTTAKLAPNFGLTQATTTTVVGNNQSISLDFANGMIQLVDATAATGSLTVTLANPEAGGFYRIFIKQPASLLTMNWPAQMKWPQGQTPIFTAALNAIDSVELYWDAVSGAYWSDWQVNYV